MFNFLNIKESVIFFFISLVGLNAIGANVEGNKVTITSEVLRKLPLTSLHWVK